MITENLPSLKINKLTQEQYDAAKAAGKINENELYMTPDSSIIVTDIVDDLTTNSTDKPLSAAQGVKLKALIDGITVPTKVSELQNDAGYLTQHQDISGKEDSSNKVTILSASSTDAQYPSAKCVYDMIGNVEALLAAL